MSYELAWLIYTIILTSVLWIPYVLNRIAVRGLLPAMGYSTSETPPHAPWAERAMHAHTNAVENMVLFAPLVLAVHVLGISTPATRAAVVVYFFARLGHYLTYVAKVPVARTLIFAIGFAAMLVLPVAILQAA